jgi:hypothetical protein
MAKLIYAAIASLDGYVEDEGGKFDWAAPDEEVHAFVNQQEREIGTYLYGRRMYETMVFWETMEAAGEPQVMRDFAEIWRAAEKIVYSTTLAEPSSQRTRIEAEFEPEAIRAEGRGRSRHRRRRLRSRGAGARRRPRRRVPSVARAGGRRRWQAGAPARPAPGPRAARRAPLRERRRPAELPPTDVDTSVGRPLS